MILRIPDKLAPPLKVAKSDDFTANDPSIMMTINSIIVFLL